MAEFEVSEEIVSKSPRIFAADLHAVIFGALAASVGQNLKISLGSSVGKMQSKTTIEVEEGQGYQTIGYLFPCGGKN